MFLSQSPQLCKAKYFIKTVACMASNFEPQKLLFLLYIFEKIRYTRKYYD